MYHWNEFEKFMESAFMTEIIWHSYLSDYSIILKWQTGKTNNGIHREPIISSWYFQHIHFKAVILKKVLNWFINFVLSYSLLQTMSWESELDYQQVVWHRGQGFSLELPFFNQRASYSAINLTLRKYTTLSYGPKEVN